MVSASINANANISQRWLGEQGRWLSLMGFGAAAAAIAWGWLNRDRGWLVSEEGLGYWLGITGASMMLLLLTYSLSKRVRVLRQLMPIKIWFQLHMMLGVLGPLCILFHSNFHLGSLNSTVALVCMLLVAGSGIVGRYFYNRIHFGLYGEKIRLKQMSEDASDLRTALLAFSPTEKARSVCNRLFDEVDAAIVKHSGTVSTVSMLKNRKNIQRILHSMHGFLRVLEKHHEKAGLRREAMADMRQQLSDSERVLRVMLDKLVGLHLFERLFSLWHVIHIPIFIVMIITTLVHIVVVHMY